MMQPTVYNLQQNIIKGNRVVGTKPWKTIDSKICMPDIAKLASMSVDELKKFKIVEFRSFDRDNVWIDRLGMTFSDGT